MRQIRLPGQHDKVCRRLVLHRWRNGQPCAEYRNRAAMIYGNSHKDHLAADRLRHTVYSAAAADILQLVYPVLVSRRNFFKHLQE